MKKTINSITMCISIGFIMSIIYSILKGDNKFYVSVPEFINKFDSEISAALISLFCYTTMGILFRMISNIYEIEKYSLFIKTFLHFMSILITVLVFGYYLCWFNFSTVISMFIIFFIIYSIIWLLMYLEIKNKINKINKKLSDK